ncbi:MAG: hypothetical protein IJH07_05790 [Ruminococcus sp.]|nr:hypothetical protein [Ruminococcus sp.]
MKKTYTSPELEWRRLYLYDVILASSQYENRQIEIGDLDPDDDDIEPGGFG